MIMQVPFSNVFRITECFSNEIKLVGESDTAALEKILVKYSPHVHASHALVIDVKYTLGQVNYKGILKNIELLSYFHNQFSSSTQPLTFFMRKFPLS